jgi:6-pyruvoyl-tetrahydropterin synthase related domain
LTVVSRKRAILALDLLVIFLFAAMLVRPLFKLKYSNRWDSIESTFIADARFLQAHWPHPQWQPLWYCGTRYDYIYPPALRYGTALLSRVWIPAKAYHIYTALLYSLGIAGVYFFVRVASRSRGAAWVAAGATALVSPSFLLLRNMRVDSPHLTPCRLWVLVRYGEGPHISSLSLLPFALGFAWLGVQRRRPASLAAAGLFSALVALTNFYGATALAIFYPVLVWSVWVTSRDSRVWLRAAAIPAIAYGLAAFWLTPSYLRITVENLRWVSSPGNRLSYALACAAAILFVVVSLRTASNQPRRAYLVFVCGGLLFMGLNVLGHFYFNFRVAGEPGRLVPELDLAMILAATEALRRLWWWSKVPSRMQMARAAAVLVVAMCAWSARHYVRHAWELYPREGDYQQRVEYRMADWTFQHLPQSRLLVIGSIRFWWDTWHDLAEVGGGSEQGVLNPYLVPAQWEMTMGTNTETAVRWLTALGADAVIVTFKQSQEVYHDFVDPHKFDGTLPVLYDDHLGNVIYQVPRRYLSLARVVDRARLKALQPIVPQTNLEALRAYTAVIEQGPDAPTKTALDGTDRMRIHARVEQGQAVVVQMTYDPAWHAYVDGKQAPVHKDALDFSVIDAPAGEHDILYVFEMPLENRIGWALMAISVIAMGVLLQRGWAQRARM